MNYYLNVSLIGSSTKNDRFQDVTIVFTKYSVIFIESSSCTFLNYEAAENECSSGWRLPA